MTPFTTDTQNRQSAHFHVSLARAVGIALAKPRADCPLPRVAIIAAVKAHQRLTPEEIDSAYWRAVRELPVLFWCPDRGLKLAKGFLAEISAKHDVDFDGLMRRAQ